MKALIFDDNHTDGYFKAIQPEEIIENLSYDEMVDREIRKKYSLSNELAILRQREEKPEEFAEYFKYCENVKKAVKSKI